MGWKLNNSTLGQRDCGIEIQQIQDWDSEIFWMETQQFHLGTVRFLGCKLNNFRFGQWDFFFFFFISVLVPKFTWKAAARAVGDFMEWILCFSEVPQDLHCQGSNQNLISAGDSWQQLCTAQDGICASEQTLTTSQNLFEMHFLSLLERQRKKKKNRRRKKQHWRELSHKSVWYEPGDLKNQSWQLFY